MKSPSSPYKKFVFRKYGFDSKSGEAVFEYGFDNEIVFSEKLAFPVSEVEHSWNEKELDRALFALHLITGISYYKAYCPKTIRIESGILTKAQAGFWNKLYTNGLGEFFYRNDLNFKGLINFPFDESAEAASLAEAESGDFGSPLVPIGGGKDSLVTIESLHGENRPITLFTLGDFPLIQKVVAAAGDDQIIVRREIDPKLFELNEKGAYNGHIPISAYIAFAAVATAILHKRKDIILSNERSASFGNIVVEGVEINHQYSKGLEFENDFQKYIAAFISLNIRYFSLLRPFSELTIAKKFAGLNKYRDIFSSCNRNFSLTRPKSGFWCGDCPKCAFVFAMLAAFMTRDEVIEIFGQDLFDRENLLGLYQELLGCKAIKPFECVGEPEEVKAALLLAHKRGDFEDSVLMKWFTDEYIPSIENAGKVIEDALKVSSEHNIPKEYLSLINS